MSEEVEVESLPPCDVHLDRFGKHVDALYDARLPGFGGMWGNVCQECFDLYGPGKLGTGHGQRFIVIKE